MWSRGITAGAEVEGVGLSNRPGSRRPLDGDKRARLGHGACVQGNGAVDCPGATLVMAERVGEAMASEGRAGLSASERGSNGTNAGELTH